MVAFLRSRRMPLSTISDLIYLHLPASVHGKVTISIEVLTSPPPNLNVLKPFSLMIFVMSSLGRVLNNSPSKFPCNG